MENRSSTDSIDRIMGSLDNLHKATAPDFFYTRLKGKMQPAADKSNYLILRPAFITTVLSILLIVNVMSLFTMNKPAKTKTGLENAGIEAFAKAYDMNSGSVYE